ncbi:fatty-acid amide hydrolase 2 [Trichonephila clavipes]|nr:fatty-acid amide hydrolase 2 [Trichonephila clavipes]
MTVPRVPTCCIGRDVSDQVGLKCEDLIEAYIDRISVVDPYINATVERSIDVALKEAREVDSLIASGKYNKKQLAEEKPLLGVPFSVKLLFSCKGKHKRSCFKLVIY